MDEESQLRHDSTARHNMHNIARKPVPATSVIHVQQSRPGGQYTSLPQQDKVSETDSKHKERAEGCGFSWTGECLCVLFALANLVSLVVLLILRKDKPLPKWPSLLGINTLVSIFSSLIKVGLLFCVAECLGELKWIWFERPQALSDFDRFDSASRGPWGACGLIVKRPSNFLSTLGAVITVIAIAVDPFTQQVLHFYSCPIPDEGQTARIVRSNNYTTGSGYSSMGTMLDPRMTGAFFQGLLNPFPNATVAVSMFCPSGNCTFTHVDDIAYSTLAMCSSVQDISSSVAGSGRLAPTSGMTGDWNYTLPSGFNITSPCALATAEFLRETYLGPQPVFEFEILATTTNCPDGYTTNDVAYLGGHCVVTPFAAHVSLTPCILSYGDVRVANSTFDENVKDQTVLNRYDWGYYAIGNHSSVAGTDCTGSQTSQGPKTMLTAMIGLPNVRIVYAFEVKGAWDYLYYDPACIFSLGSGPGAALEAGLGSMFGSKDSPQQVWLDYGMWRRGTGDDWIKVLWNLGGRVNVSSVTQVVEGLTTSINSMFRSEGDVSNSEPVNGVVLVNQTCVGVVWAWLALPVVLCALTVGLLVSTIFQCQVHNRKRGLGGSRKPWKTSSLPMLWCGLSEYMKEGYGRLDSVEHMREVGDGLKVNIDAEGQLNSDGQSGADGFHSLQRWRLKSASS